MQVSGGLRHSYCDADRQTPEARRRPGLLALWNVKQRMARACKSGPKWRTICSLVDKNNQVLSTFSLLATRTTTRLCIRFWTSRENTKEFRRQHYEMHRIATAS